MKTAAIVVAAGASTRFGRKTKKQFSLLAGKPLVVYPLRVLNHSRYINRIILVVPAGQINLVERQILQKERFDKITDIIAGGEERTDSVWNALRLLHESQLPNRNLELVLIHDGVRPFITEKMIRDTIQIARRTGAACIATKITDTVKLADANLIIQKTIPRDNLWCVQTPQVFKFTLLFEAYQDARNKNRKSTDDAGILEYRGIPVTLVPGPVTNIKITTQQDMVLAETILTSRCH
ncbi:MAG: 2-C-methyl-D-erythritol 4-phosphate cytidylyltransferase [bacterium]|nr:2-C-methyl-D-erythritol 4-phosphate cytidylyltransferase [bacterium]